MSDSTEAHIDRAVAWARAQLGSCGYAFKCLSFVEDAYERGCGIEIDGQGYSAKEAADAYGAHERSGPPPRGSFVFYDCWGPIAGERRNWGHVGLCVGEGRVVHPWGAVREDDYLAVATLGGDDWTQPAYIGWVPAERVLVGMRERRDS